MAVAMVVPCFKKTVFFGGGRGLGVVVVVLVVFFQFQMHKKG